VLDGFVIEGNVLEHRPLEAAKAKTHPLKRAYLAILVSIVVHLLLALLLFSISEKQQPKQVEITKKAIKSYLYKRPSKPVIAEVVVDKQILEEPEVKEEIKVEEKPEVVKPNKVAKNDSSTVVESSESKFTSSKKIQKPIQATFSAYKQLSSLRNSINEKMMADELSDLQQFRSPSVMHGEQIPVPHSTEQLTPEQEREKKTTRISDDISITKYDNGICTIEREQFLGSPVEGSSSAFACGESQFDKGFREHMKEVRDKIMPTKNK